MANKLETATGLNSPSANRLADANALLDVQLLDLAFDDQLTVMANWMDNLTEGSLQLIRGQLKLFTFVTSKQLETVITLIYDTAVTKQDRNIYARVCVLLANKTGDNFGCSSHVTTFKYRLLDHCQSVFERITSGSLSCPAAVDFIGQLFNVHLLTPGLLRLCIEKLVDGVAEKGTEAAWTHAHTLLRSVGAELEISVRENPDRYPWNVNHLLDRLQQNSRRLSADGAEKRLAQSMDQLRHLRQTSWIPAADRKQKLAQEQQEYQRYVQQFNKQVDVMTDNLKKVFNGFTNA